MKILFMGTPDFAVASLKALCDEKKYDISVITTPDKPKGRGYELQPTPVKRFALDAGLSVYQPETLRGDDFSEWLSENAPDLIVVAAYGKILPENVLRFPRFGCINVHGSLLPRYRGAAPIQRAIINGEEETGVTIMNMNAGLDTGDMLTKVVVPIGENDNFEVVFDRMAAAGAKALVHTIPLIMAGVLVPEKQDEQYATYAQKIGKEDCLIDFSEPAKTVHDRIRGLSPIPLGYVMRGDKPLKLIASRLTGEKSDQPAGTVVGTDNGRITVSCGDGACLAITEVLPSGKKRMSSADYLRGNSVSVGEVFVKPVLKAEP